MIGNMTAFFFLWENEKKIQQINTTQIYEKILCVYLKINFSYFLML